jgi:hypothetical protein
MGMVRHLFRVVVLQTEVGKTTSLSLGVNEELQFQILMLQHINLCLPVGGEDGVEHLH